MRTLKKKLKVGIVGCGAIGTQLAVFIEKELGRYFVLSGLYDIVSGKAAKLARRMHRKLEVPELSKLIYSSDMMIEAASVSCARDLINNAYNKDKIIFIMSSGVFVKYLEVFKKTRFFKRIIVPSGAVCGIDGIESLASGKIKFLKLITSKPPSSLTGVKFIEDKGIDITRIKKERVLFRGGIKEAVEYFPKNINVAATLFLASQFDDIKVIIKADPNIKRNTHHIEMESDEGKLSITLENVPSKTNPKTSAMAILSAKNALRKFTSTFLVGS